MSISVEEFTALQTQFLEFKSANYELKEKQKSLSDELERTKTELKKANEVIQKSKKNVEFQNLRKENDHLTVQIEQAHKENQEQQKALRENIKSLFDSNSEIQDELDRHKKLVEDLQKQLQSRPETDESDEKIKRLEDEIAELKRSEESRKKQLDMLTTSLKSSVSAEHEETIANGHVSAEPPKLDFANLESQLDALKTDDHPNLDKEAVLRLFQEAWNEKAGDLAKSLADKAAPPPSPRIDAARVLEFQEQIKQQEAAHEARVKGLQEQLDALHEKLKKKRSDLKELRKKSEKLNEENQAKFEETIRKKDEEIAQQTAALKKRNEEYARLEADVARHKEELSVVQDDRGEIIAMMTEKDLKIDGLRDEVAIHKHGEEKNKAALDAANETLQKERENFTVTLKQRVEQIAKLSNDLSEQKFRITDLEERLTSLRQSKEEAVGLNKEYTKKIKELEEATAHKEKEHKILHNLVEDLKHKLVAAEATVNETEEKLEAAQEELDAKKAVSNQLNETTNSLEIEISDLKDEIAQLQERRDRLIDDTKEKDAKIATLEHQARADTKEKEELKAKVAELEAALESNKAELSEVTQKSQSAEEELRTLQEKLAATEEQREAAQKELDGKAAEIAAISEEHAKKVEELTTAVEDAQMQVKLVEKKSGRIVKDLQDQLMKERRSFDKQIIQVQNNLSLPGTPEKPMRKSASAATLSSSQPHSPLNITPSASRERPPPMDINVELLQKELNQLATVVGSLQSEKWNLEENVRSLESALVAMQEEVQKKEQIIKGYALELKVGRATPAMEMNKLEKTRKGGGLSKVFGGSRTDLTVEMAQKMEAVLEDTLLKNIQLQNDLKTMGDEVTRLQSQVSK
eukprot:TRINITY_DN1463_c0_g1_i1.p1 TRINITY_DN1463_c0_g1~~TRINITY_DN1463_c0_g1_i1.p1  ORF type:complete len:865 (+),score=364.11 TRINITY_DN1463_c0_g1_i1:162-2756(+)